MRWESCELGGKRGSGKMTEVNKITDDEIHVKRNSQEKENVYCLCVEKRLEIIGGF